MAMTENRGSTPYISTVEAFAPEPDMEELNGLTVLQLKSILRDCSLKLGGRKKDHIEAIQEVLSFIFVFFHQ